MTPMRGKLQIFAALFAVICAGVAGSGAAACRGWRQTRPRHRADPQEHLPAVGRRRKHHRIDRPGWRPAGRFRQQGRERPGAGGHSIHQPRNEWPWQQATLPGDGEGKEESVLTTTAPPKPIRFIINTSARPEHTGGNESLGKAGRNIHRWKRCRRSGAEAGEGAAILSFDKVLDQLSDEKVPFAALPTVTYFGTQMKLSHFFNGEGVQLLHIPNGVSDGDSIVHFRGSDVIAVGDLITLNSYPVIDRKHGGSVQGLLAGLNRLLDMIVPEFRTEGGTLVVPGHGRIIDDADVAYYRDMVTIVRDRVQDMIKKDMTLAQIQESKPTADWDPIYGSDASWTPDMFVESIYRSLMDNAQKK